MINRVFMFVFYCQLRIENGELDSDSDVLIVDDDDDDDDEDEDGEFGNRVQCSFF